jgi:hypothetical protein
MWNNKRITKEAMKKEGIHTENDANKFMDKIADNLNDSALKRAYLGAKRKYDRKPNNSTKYIFLYFEEKCKKRGIKL